LGYCRRYLVCPVGRNRRVVTKQLPGAIGGALSLEVETQDNHFTKGHEVMGIIDDIGGIVSKIEDGTEWFGGVVVQGVKDLSNGAVDAVPFVADGIKYIVDHTQFWTEVGLVLGTGVTLLVPGGYVFGPFIAIAGLVKDLLTRMREMTAAEIGFADRLFQGTIPYDRVVLTDTQGFGGRFFTTPSLQPGSDKILVNIGDHFDNPPYSTSSAYPAPGQAFIHELTHAWQIAQASFVPGLVCDGIWNQIQYSFGTDVYAIGTDAGKEWSEYNLEQQAHLVDRWHQGYRSRGHRYYRYIKDNIQTGSRGSSRSRFSYSEGERPVPTGQAATGCPVAPRALGWR